MDAKPQRPMRALRVRDENAPPQMPAGKTIHQRNKSTPALSNLVNPGGIKAATAKRNVLGDVGNTRHRAAKDDMQVPGKVKEVDLLKDPAVVSAKELPKPGPLARPAQRPLVNITNKVNGTNGVENILPAGTKQVSSDAHVKKIASKKSTVVLKETQSDPPPESTTIPAPTLRPTERAVKVHARETVISLPEDESDYEKVEHPVDGKERVCAEITESEAEHKDSSTRAPVEDKYEYVDALEEQARALEQERNEEIAKSTRLSTLEQDEYWDEEDEDYYDADGYTTARSLQTRGDNTTGGVTLQLAPRVTAKSQRELETARQWVEVHKTPEDVEDEQWDTSMVAEYGDEIFEYMRALENRMKPNASYMDNQAEIQWSMRSVLMDWLVQVHNRFNLLPETLFLAVNYVDRFLSCKVVSLGKLQLVGATALFVAAKYEEINCPSVQEIVYMVDGAYQAEEVLKAERFMLNMLHFELGWPGPMSFLRRISKADDYDLETRTLAKYFLEMTVMDERFVGCGPSFLAAGAHCLARFMLKKGDWSLAHVHYSGYTLSQLRQLITIMLECCDNPQKHHSAVYDKYTDKRYKRASVFVEKELSNGFQLPFVSRDSLAGQSHSWRRK